MPNCRLDKQRDDKSEAGRTTKESSINKQIEFDSNSKYMYSTIVHRAVERKQMTYNNNGCTSSSGGVLLEE